MWLPAPEGPESKLSSARTASGSRYWNLVAVRSSSPTQEFLKKVSGEGDPRARLDVLLIKQMGAESIAANCRVLLSGVIDTFMVLAHGLAYIWPA